MEGSIAIFSSTREVALRSEQNHPPHPKPRDITGLLRSDPNLPLVKPPRAMTRFKGFDLSSDQQKPLEVRRIWLRRVDINCKVSSAKCSVVAKLGRHAPFLNLLIREILKDGAWS